MSDDPRQLWAAVDEVVAGYLLPDDPTLDAAQAAAADAGLPPISVSATQGKLLQLLVRAIAARRVLEIGTLAAYSTIWMARALPEDGRLVTLEGPFDLAFVDADKEHNADYFEWCLRLVRPGGLIIIDNVIRQGQIADASNDESRVEGVRRLFATIQDHPDAASTAIQTVGIKGHDGFTLTVVPG